MTLLLSSITLRDLFVAAGWAQLGILIASALVPFKLQWREALRPLPRLLRQLVWVYGAYVVLAIVAFAVISLRCAGELAARGPLARGFSAYVAVFWGARLTLQWVFDVRPHLTRAWLKVGYHALTAVFAGLAALYGWAAVAPVHVS
jgi:hypothetical protein